MNTAYIIAPVAGTIAEVAAKQFDVITLDAATTEVLAIRMEDLSAYEIDVAVSEMDINSISLGQTAEMTFDAVPLHMFTGKIVRISNVGLTTGTKVTYDMTILMDQTDALVRPGMMADIVVNTREVPDALYVSDKVVKTAEDGSRYVERLSADGTFEKIPVTVGIVSGTKTQILSDQIKAGDTVKAALQTSISIGGAGSGEVPELFVGRPGGGPRR
jgi:HlyD family secretion protein